MFEWLLGKKDGIKLDPSFVEQTITRINKLEDDNQKVLEDFRSFELKMVKKFTEFKEFIAKLQKKIEVLEEK